MADKDLDWIRGRDIIRTAAADGLFSHSLSLFAEYWCTGIPGLPGIGSLHKYTAFK